MRPGRSWITSPALSFDAVSTLILPRMTVFWTMLFVVASVQTAPGQNGGSPPALPSGSALLTSALGILSDGSAAAQDLTLTGTVAYTAGSTQDNGTVTLKALQGGFIAYTLSLSSQTIEEVRSRTASGTIAGTRKDSFGQRAIPGRNLMIAPYWFEPELLLSTYIGDATWLAQSQLVTLQDGTSLLRITSARQPEPGNPLFDVMKVQSSTDVDLDPVSLLPVAVTYHEFAEGQRVTPVTIRLVYSNFQAVTGHMIPFHVQRYVNGTLNLDITLSSAQVNSGLAASDFQLQ